MDVHEADRAEPAFADHAIARSDEMRRAAALHADLHDTLVLARGGQHGLPLDDVDADRLLHPDIRAGLDGIDHRQRVPVIGCDDDDDVEVALLEHLPVVGVGARRLLRHLPRRDQRSGVGEHRLVDITQRDDVDGRDLDEPQEIRLAVPSGADEADSFAGVGKLLRKWERRESQCGGAGREKVATMHEQSPRADSTPSPVLIDVSIRNRSKPVCYGPGMHLPDLHAAQNLPDPRRRASFRDEGIGR